MFNNDSFHQLFKGLQQDRCLLRIDAIISTKSMLLQSQILSGGIEKRHSSVVDSTTFVQASKK